MTGPFGDALTPDEVRDILDGKRKPHVNPNPQASPFGEAFSAEQVKSKLESSGPKPTKRKLENRHPNKWDSYTQYRWHCDGCGTYKMVAVVNEKQRSNRRLCKSCYTIGRDLVDNWRPAKPVRGVSNE